MTCNITNTPHIAEPLPLYRRDPETASILSSAPSYVSDAPTYSSNRPDAATHTASAHGASSPANSGSTISTPSQSTVNLNQQSAPRRRHGLPNRAFAPGWRAPANGTLSELDAHNYDMINWSNVRSSGTHRTYHNVAQRRASAATASALQTFANDNSSSASINLTAEASFPRSPEPTPYALDATAITTPLEDPYLVGEIAAKQARQARLYREMCLRGEEAVRYEGKSWDFMVKQLEDEEERSRQWKRFKEQAVGVGGSSSKSKAVGGGKLLGTRGRLMRRLGSGSWS